MCCPRVCQLLHLRLVAPFALPVSLSPPMHTLVHSSCLQKEVMRKLLWIPGALLRLYVSTEDGFLRYKVVQVLDKLILSRFVVDGGSMWGWLVGGG